MTITGRCHCGKTAFRIEGDIPAKLTRCTCSFCSTRGALMAYYPPAQFHVTTPSNDDATYRWNTKLVAHHFCPECGCATFSDSPAFEPDGSWDKRTRRIGRQRPPVRQLRRCRCTGRGHRRQEPVVASMPRHRAGPP